VERGTVGGVVEAGGGVVSVTGRGVDAGIGVESGIKGVDAGGVDAGGTEAAGDEGVTAGVDSTSVSGIVVLILDIVKTRSNMSPSCFLRCAMLAQNFMISEVCLSV